MLKKRFKFTEIFNTKPVFHQFLFFKKFLKFLFFVNKKVVILQSEKNREKE